MKKAILILGMHRSGTSLVSGCLRLSGIDFGSGVMQPDSNNQKGYWEQNDIVVVHDRLLESFDLSWHSVGNLPDNWLEHPSTAEAERQICEILQANFSQSGLWALKDPRLCRFLPLWNRIFEKLGITPAYIHVVRAPIETARSIHKRDPISMDHAKALWLRYNYDVLKHTSAYANKITIALDAFSKAPVEAIQEILNSIEAPFDLSDNNRKQIRNFYDDSLKHHTDPKTATSGEEPLNQFYLDMLQQRSAGLEAGPLGSLFRYLGELEYDIALKKTNEIVTAEILSNPGNYVAAEIFVPAASRSSLNKSRTMQIIPADTWHRFVCPVKQAHSIAQHGFRFDPCNTPGEIHISSCTIKRSDNGEELARYENWGDLFLSEDAVRIEESKASLKIISIGKKPHCHFPAKDIPENIPITIEIWFYYSRIMPTLRAKKSILRRLHALRDPHTDQKLIRRLKKVFCGK